MMGLEKQIKELALGEGFAAVGITTAEPLSRLEPLVETRVRDGYLGGMPWFDLARVRRVCRPQELAQGARSIIALAFAYGNPSIPWDFKPVERHGLISRYAGAADYHRVVKSRVERLLQFVRDHETEPYAQLSCDSGRLLDRGFAQRAGLGWYGKNSAIIVPGWGSWVFLAEIVTSLSLEADEPGEGDCGRCDACLRSCPTGALVAPYVVDARRCISFLTIELKGQIPRDLRPLIGTRVFGCDACQACCPHNQHTHRPPWTELRAVDETALVLELPELLGLGDQEFKQRFRESPLLRARRSGLLRNAAVALGNEGDSDSVRVLCQALFDPDPIVRGHVAWSLGQIGAGAGRTALEHALGCETDDAVASEIALAVGLHHP